MQIGTYALHHLGAYRDRGSFPGADRAFARALALPFATTMTEAECDRVAEALARFVCCGEAYASPAGHVRAEAEAASDSLRAAT